jgi:hypothetical protein
MWHRLDGIVRGLRKRETVACEACGEPAPLDRVVLVQGPDGRTRRLCSPYCQPAVWKKMVGDRQKLSKSSLIHVKREERGRA